MTYPQVSHDVLHELDKELGIANSPRHRFFNDVSGENRAIYASQGCYSVHSCSSRRRRGATTTSYGGR